MPLPSLMMSGSAMTCFFRSAICAGALFCQVLSVQRQSLGSPAEFGVACWWQ